MRDYRIEQRRAALQEAKALEAWLKGAIDEHTLQIQLQGVAKSRARIEARQTLSSDHEQTVHA